MALFLKILCDLPKQRKFIAAGPIAGWLWLAGVGHCRLSSTDGFIPALVVPTLVPGLKSPFKHAETLCRVGLWHVVTDGYQVHDYLAMNPSKAEIADMRRRDVDRKRTDSASLSEWIPNGIQTEPPRGRAAASRGRVSSPSPSGNGATGVNSEESARETTAFEKFWDAYPRKEGKGAAEKAFAKQSGHLDAMLLALTVQRQSRQWLDSGGQFIPHPSTWLNQRRWEDSGVDVPTPKVVPDWRAECDRVHGGTNGSFCGNGFMHAARMKDATEDIKGDA